MKKLTGNELSEARKLAAYRIGAYFTRGLYAEHHKTATTYGFTLDNYIYSIHAEGNFGKELLDYLDREGIEYKVKCESFHTGIHISAKQENIWKFIKLGEKLWETVVAEENRYLQECKEAWEKVDLTTDRPLHWKYSSVILAHDGMADAEKYFKGGAGSFENFYKRKQFVMLLLFVQDTIRCEHWNAARIWQALDDLQKLPLSERMTQKKLWLSWIYEHELYIRTGLWGGYHELRRKGVDGKYALDLEEQSVK